MEYTISGLRGESLFESLVKAGLAVDSPCGGAGTCGKCRVRVLSSDLEAPEPARGEVFGEGDPSRESAPVWTQPLSCRTRFVRDGSARVDIAEKSMRIVDHFELPMPEGKPAISIRELSLPEPVLENAGSELARIEAATGIPAESSLDFSRELARRLDPDDPGSRRLKVALQEGGWISLAGENDAPILSAAVDIGTTTVAIRILDSLTGEALASGAQANVQRWAGADVISRIGTCASDEAFARLSGGIAGQIARMLVSLAESAGGSASSIRRIVVAGNPTMIHILAGVNPAGIARAPFVPVFARAFDLAPRDSPFGERFGRDCRTILLPGVSAYVGADLVAGALACGLDRKDAPNLPALLLDLGTNGEIMLFTREASFCSSAAAGPAFEGASIEFGSPSVPGAIDHVRNEGGRIVADVIGHGAATGICGSGILDAVACLLDSGAVDETGRIDPEGCGAPGAGRLGAECFVDYKGKPAIILDRESGILITQDDIRQVQLAKAAVAAGVDILLAHAGLGATEVKTVYLAGGFGSRLDPHSALRIGLLQGGFSGRVKAVGNSSLAGAETVALKAGALAACSQMAKDCRAVELSGRLDFVSAFSEAMFFPET
jgi:uncharacterized 2Fe-2S/4Fe-4S cluster protein (DUF4445 family)